MRDIDRMNDTVAERREMRERLLRSVALRGRIARSLMTEREWDFLFVGFSELHQAGHFYWHGADPHHPRHAEIRAQGLADTLREVYEAVDREIGSLLEHLEPESLMLVLAAHGMGPLYHASWNVQDFLDLWGYGPRAARRAEPGQRADASVWRALRKVLPGGLQYTIRDLLPRRLRNELLFRWYAGRRDWKGWRAIAVPNNDTVAAVRVAVAGRDPGGVVEPGEEYQAVLDDLSAAFEELVEPVSARKLVRQVYRVHELLAGEYLVDKPDLCVAWQQSFPWSSVESPRFGRLGLRLFDARTGSHTRQGFFCALGPGVAAGATIKGCSLYDVAPTVLAVAGVAPPANLEGRPLPLFGDQARA